MPRGSPSPALARADRGLLGLSRTSKAGAGDLQDLIVDGTPLYQHVAAKVAREWNENGTCGLVVGGTGPGQLRDVGNLLGDLPFLGPGVGAQGGDVAKMVVNARTAAGDGLMISSSRAILYAGGDEDFAAAARAATLSLRDEVNRHRFSASR